MGASTAVPGPSCHWRVSGAPLQCISDRFHSQVRVTGGAVRTFSGEHHRMSRFPYETLYVALLIAQALAVLAWVMYTLT
jgi:hypothetical protein